MFTYSIMPLDTDHFDEIVDDVRDQYKRGISTCPMFMMRLAPEGVPVWDKAGPLCEKFRSFREALEPEGIPVGILVQSSLGHGYPLVPSPFNKYVSLVDGEEKNVYCPLDENFIGHFKEVLRTLAREKPSAIMLDDDFRLVMRPNGQGCACPRHLKLLEKKTGKRFTRESLYAHIMSSPDNDSITRAFLDIQSETLVYAATEFRSAIDEIDPKIQGINCTSGDLCESVIYTSRAFAGRDNPTVVRVPNGTYSPISIKEFSHTMRCAAVCSSKLKKHGVDHVLAETDTIPYNRYGKNARYLHSHYTASVLEGLEGAKHWITRLDAFEPKSGKAFRDILAEHSALYEKLAALSDEIRWVGANSMFVEQKYHSYHRDDIWSYSENFWATKVFERMGLPFYFSERAGEANLLEGNIVNDMTDEEIRSIFSGSVFATGDVAETLAERGFSDLLGVDVSSWDGDTISGEIYGTSSLTSKKQMDSKMITVTDRRVEELSHCYIKTSGKDIEILFPAVTALKRDGGRLSVVYAGTPDAPHNYLEGFAFLNETRKGQFIDLLKRAGALPVYCDSDTELCLRAGYLKDGRLLCAVFNLSYDPLKTLDIYLEKVPLGISLLDKTGCEIPVSFTKQEESIYSLDIKVEPMYPVIVIIG